MRARLGALLEAAAATTEAAHERDDDENDEDEHDDVHDPCLPIGSGSNPCERGGGPPGCGRWPTGSHCAMHRLDCEPLPSSVRSARLFVVDQLQAWRFDDLVDRVALLTSELATNAVVHTGKPYSVSVVQRGPTVRVEVADRDQQLPTLIDLTSGGLTPDASLTEDHEEDRERLFSGLGIVDATATAWGSEVIPGDGKIVWFEVDKGSDASAGRSADMQDLRDAPPSPLAQDLDRPLDDWMVALDRPTLPLVARVLIGILLLVVCVLVFLMVRG